MGRAHGMQERGARVVHLGEGGWRDVWGVVDVNVLIQTNGA